MRDLYSTQQMQVIYFSDCVNAVNAQTLQIQGLCNKNMQVFQLVSGVTPVHIKTAQWASWKGFSRSEDFITEQREICVSEKAKWTLTGRTTPSVLRVKCRTAATICLLTNITEWSHWHHSDKQAFSDLYQILGGMI